MALKKNVMSNSVTPRGLTLQERPCEGGDGLPCIMGVLWWVMGTSDFNYIYSLGPSLPNLTVSPTGNRVILGSYTFCHKMGPYPSKDALWRRYSLAGDGHWISIGSATLAQARRIVQIHKSYHLICASLHTAAI